MSTYKTTLTEDEKHKLMSQAALLHLNKGSEPLTPAKSAPVKRRRRFRSPNVTWETFGWLLIALALGGVAFSLWWNLRQI